nr:hypothetical protein BaRGS_015896 [Batillaria attramentaria]
MAAYTRGKSGGTPSREVIEANKKLLQELEEGDLVEFPRVGYSHWAVYVGNGKVVHLTSDDGDAVDDDELDIPDPYDDLAKKATRKASVQEADLLEVAGNSKAKKNNSKDSRFPPLPKDTIVKNAKDKLGKTGYHVVVQNCEHFASWCRYGVAVSDQAEKFLKSFLGKVFGGSANPGTLSGFLAQ